MSDLKIPFLYTPAFKRHGFSDGHPESPLRVEAIVRFLASGPLAPRLETVEPRAASFEELLLVHTEDYLLRLEEACLQGLSSIDGPDNEISPDSFEVARLAAGAALKAVDLVEKGYPLALCPVRPPGHHALPGRALGFCLLNNVALAARYWQENFGRRLLILDWDAHHGNGIQEVFYEDPQVFYVSLHEDPQQSFPGTGFPEERGQGAGEGYTLNVPLPLESGDLEILRLFEKIVEPAVEGFSPEGIVLACGFDGHREDDFSFLNLSTQVFEELSCRVRGWQRKFGAPVISVLEGGYHLPSLAASYEAHLCGLLGK